VAQLYVSSHESGCVTSPSKLESRQGHPRFFHDLVKFSHKNCRASLRVIGLQARVNVNSNGIKYFPYVF